MTEQQQQVKGGNSPTAKLNNNQSQKLNHALVIIFPFSMFVVGCIIAEVAAGLSQKSE